MKCLNTVFRGINNTNLDTIEREINRIKENKNTLSKLFNIKKIKILINKWYNTEDNLIMDTMVDNIKLKFNNVTQIKTAWRTKIRNLAIFHVLCLEFKLDI